MKVKLLKKIRKRFCIINETENNVYFSKVEYMQDRNIRQNKVIYDDKTCTEWKITVYSWNYEVKEVLKIICNALNNPLFSYSNWYNKKLQKSINKKLRNKYTRYSFKK